MTGNFVFSPFERAGCITSILNVCFTNFERIRCVSIAGKYSRSACAGSSARVAAHANMATRKTGTQRNAVRGALMRFGFGSECFGNRQPHGSWLDVVERQGIDAPQASAEDA